jgi:hypothetical protein
MYIIDNSDIKTNILIRIGCSKTFALNMYLVVG